MDEGAMVACWDAVQRWLHDDMSEESRLYWMAQAVLLRLDLVYRVGRWDGRGWPEGA